MGVHQGHSTAPGAQPGADQVGGSNRGGLPLPAVGGSGQVMGQEEEQQQHDLREAQPGDEVEGHSCQTHNGPTSISFIAPNITSCFLCGLYNQSSTTPSD